MPAFLWHPLSWTSIPFLRSCTIRYAEGMRIGAKEAHVVKEQQGQMYEDVTSDDHGGSDNGWIDDDDSIALGAFLLEQLNSAAARVFQMQSLCLNQF